MVGSLGGYEMQFNVFEWFGGLWDWILGVLLWFWGIIKWLVIWILDVIDGIWVLAAMPENFMFLIRAILMPGLIFVLLALIFTVWYTRKIWARVQDRRGPTHVGKYGGFQLFADAIKLMAKETIIPDKAKRWMYRILPSLLLVIVLLTFAFIPWDPYWNILGAPGSAFPDLSVSLVLIFALLTAVPVFSLLIGWVSGSKYSLIGGFRAANNQFAAEIPMVISSVGPAMLAGSLSMFSIVAAQTSIWYIVLLPINFATFFVASIASVGTFPFDAPVADSEIIFGWRTELSGIYFTVVYFAEFAEQMLYSALMVALFFGGFNGLPFLPGIVNFLIKWLVVYFLFTVVTSSFYRLRQDQIVHLCWKYLIPLSVLNIVLVMFAVVYIPGLLPLVLGG
ncbi:MAG: NADH-quinone oxidoreductase subunit H [Candidatus Thorarchaeota archaeon]|nr:MAG: NADH-quinone oxidoreductase subunit H [Candidatus Thorarchaeota archaeon]